MRNGSLRTEVDSNLDQQSNETQDTDTETSGSLDGVVLGLTSNVVGDNSGLLSSLSLSTDGGANLVTDSVDQVTGLDSTVSHGVARGDSDGLSSRRSSRSQGLTDDVTDSNSAQWWAGGDGGSTVEDLGSVAHAGNWSSGGGDQSGVQNWGRGGETGVESLRQTLGVDRSGRSNREQEAGVQSGEQRGVG